MYIIDCTLRDGGYYNNWDFPHEVVNLYLQAMSAAKIDIVELGLRSLKNTSFKGACAFTTDEYIRSLNVPASLRVAVMVNASELFSATSTLEQVLEELFPRSASESPVSLVRIACHVHEFAKSLPAISWLKARGYDVGFNLMQVADREQAEVEALAQAAAKWPLDVLYFADSLGNMSPAKTSQIIGWFRTHWRGALGIHTHDNMGLALSNTLRALEDGVTWLDATVTGMGRGPGNVKTEYLIAELERKGSAQPNIIPLMTLIEQYFKPMQHKYGWGTNPYYYLSGKYGIHPTYIQEMLADTRYGPEDLLAAIQYLRVRNGKSFRSSTLDAARNFFRESPCGEWNPADLLAGREILLLGTGPGVEEHKQAIESYIRRVKPYVMALNTQSKIDSSLIDARVACHPVRLLADHTEHLQMPQPLITPASMLPEDVRNALQDKQVLDYGVVVEPGKFEFNQYYSTIPSSMVFAYALAIAVSGKASRLHLAGFDGYGSDDQRSVEVQGVLDDFKKAAPTFEISAITPSRYAVGSKSIYAM